MVKQSISALIVGLCLIGLVDKADALPITYSFEGVGSGSLNNVAFDNSAFSFELHADTDKITNYGVFKVRVISSAINITGFSTASFNPSVLNVFMNPSFNALGFQDTLHGDLLDISDDALAGYNLATSIDVIYEPDPTAYNQFVNVATTSGPMSLSNVDWVNFSATVVPEPSSALLLAVGSGGVIFYRRAKERKKMQIPSRRHFK